MYMYMYMYIYCRPSPDKQKKKRNKYKYKKKLNKLTPEIIGLFIIKTSHLFNKHTPKQSLIFCLKMTNEQYTQYIYKITNYKRNGASKSCSSYTNVFPFEYIKQLYRIILSGILPVILFSFI